MIKMKKKFTLVDYAIIILVIAAVIFAFVHITSDDKSTSESTSYDSSTFNKIVEKYLNYYRQGYIVNTTVNGYNATTGEQVTISGTIIWMDDDKGTNVKGVVNSNGTNYIVGLYNHVPNADIYVNSMTLEINGEKYSNVTEIKINPQNISSINDLISGIPNGTNYEISTTISLDSLDSNNLQEIINSLFADHDRISIKGSNNIKNQIIVVRATADELTQVNNLLGDFNGVTSEIVIRIYNSNDNDINTIKNNYDVKSIQKI